MFARARGIRRAGLDTTLLLVLGVVTTACAEARAARPSSGEDDVSEPTALTTNISVAVAGPVLAPEPVDELPACPDGMLLVEGSYCPEVRQTCKRWLDPEGRYHEFRCAEYAKPARCVAPRKKMRFCIDRDEYVEPGESLPKNFQSLTMASRTCESIGKRVCRESEFNFACEGEEMRPYPYGFERDAAACNADRTDLFTRDGILKDLRVPANEYARCVSPFGVRHMAGNLEEFVAMDGPRPLRPAMKGAYWQPSRNFCRAAQTAHDAHYNGIETGFRCCAYAPAGRSAARP